MIRRLLGRIFGRETPSADAAYAAIVAQARQPAFFSGAGVPDTPEGRFRVVGLHVILLLDALMAGQNGIEGPEEERAALARAVQEKFFDELDASLREMGVSDLAVPKRMRRLADAFFAQLGALRTALEAGDDAVLQDALVRHIYAETDESGGAAALAAYARRARAALRGLPFERALTGRLPWPSAGSMNEGAPS